MKSAESIAEYILWLMKKYQEIKQIHQDAAYKVVSVENTTNNAILTIQISAKNTIFKATPQEIIGQDNFLEYFSKKDIRLISYLAFNAKPKKARIVMQEFCEKVRKNIFSILHPDEEKILKLSASEITVDKKVLNSLAPDEALMVGYLLADESFSIEKEVTQKKNK